MINESKTFSGFSVNDIQQAKDFYGNTLKLDIKENMGGIELHLKGGSTIWVYAKPNHEPATFTILNFAVDNVEKEVAELKNAGVVFESYNEKEIKTDEDNIHRDGGPTIAWFKDPAGNILSIIKVD